MKIVSENALTTLAVVVSGFVVAISGYSYYLNPERPWAYLLAIFVLCLAWTTRHFVGVDGQARPALQDTRRQLTEAIVLSGLLLATALGAKLIAQLGWMTGFVGDLGERSLGLIMGATVVVFANAIPKQLSTARGLAMLRISGWALVLGGLGYAMAWLLLPLKYANPAALVALLFAATYGAVRVAWYCVKHRSISPPTA